jgi:Cu2+-exporting ATPase
VLVGSLRYLQQQGISVPEHARAFANRSGEEGTSIVFVACNDKLIGALGYADEPRPEAAAVLQRLRERGIDQFVMLTGDNTYVACAVARRLGIGRIEAEVFPEQKADVVRRLQAEGHRVGVVGDGINDSPALAYADVSISLKAASDVARETADIVLHGDLHGLPDAIDLSRDSLKLIRQNLMIVAVPNGIGILLASLGLLGPVAATAINNGSNVAAALNGLRPLVRRPAPATG